MEPLCVHVNRSANVKLISTVAVLILIGLSAVLTQLNPVGNATASAWLEFIGTLHPMLLHLPIGLWFGVLFLLMYRSRNATYHIWVVRGATLVFACGLLAFATGWMLYFSGTYGTSSLKPHMYSAWSFVAASGAFLIFARTDARLSILWCAAVVVSLAIGAAGHIGGVITHGSPMNKAPWKTVEKAGNVQSEEMWPAELEVASDQPLVFNELILPVLGDKCIFCHGNRRARGNLNLSSMALILEGGTSGPALVDGDPQASLLIQRITLPLEHEHHMPPEGQYQLEGNEEELLVWWVSNGIHATMDQVPGEFLPASTADQ